MGRVLQVFCLDVGQGDCTFVLPPDGAPPILFDCKDAHVARMFVRCHRLREISAIVFSHLDDDHIAGGEQFIKDFLADGGSIRFVYVDSDRDVSRRSNGSKTATGLLDFVRRNERAGKFEALTPRADPSEVDRSVKARDWSIRIVGPRQSTLIDVARSELGDEPNVYSAVLRAEFGGNAVLIGGDAPLSSWARIQAEDVPARAFRIPHHGGALDDGGRPDGWSPERLYGMVGPSIGVISVGTRNGHGHPRAEWVRPLLSRTGCSTVCTQITPRCDPRLVSSEGARDLARVRRADLRHCEEALLAWRHRPDGRARGKDPPREEVPCAGSIAIVLHEDGRIERLPAAGALHERHVHSLPGAWCVHCPP